MTGSIFSCHVTLQSITNFFLSVILTGKKKVLNWHQEKALRLIAMHKEYSIMLLCIYMDSSYQTKLNMPFFFLIVKMTSGRKLPNDETAVSVWPIGMHPEYWTRHTISSPIVSILPPKSHFQKNFICNY